MLGGSFQGDLFFFQIGRRHKPHLPPSLPTLPSFLSSYLLLLLLLILLGEERVDPPDLGEHAAVRHAEAQAKKPEAELEGRGGEGTSTQKCDSVFITRDSI